MTHLPKYSGGPMYEHPGACGPHPALGSGSDHRLQSESVVSSIPPGHPSNKPATRQSQRQPAVRRYCSAEKCPVVLPVHMDRARSTHPINFSHRQYSQTTNWRLGHSTAYYGNSQNERKRNLISPGAFVQMPSILRYTNGRRSV